MDSWVTAYRTRDMEVPDEGQLPRTRYAGVMGNYGDVLGLELLHGRWFDARERADSQPVVIIDQRFAEDALGGDDPLGRQVFLGDPNSDESGWHTVVGVTEATVLSQLDDPDWPTAFVPLVQATQRFLTVAVHTRGAPFAFSEKLRQAVFDLDPD